MWRKTNANHLPADHLPGENKRRGEQAVSACECGEKMIDTDHSHPSHQIHHVENTVRNMLLRIPHVTFSNLVIHRVPEGVCLEGRMHADAETPDICLLLRGVEGIDRVVNRLSVEHEGADAEVAATEPIKH